MSRMIGEIEVIIHGICDVLEGRPALLANDDIRERLTMLNEIPFRELEGDDLASYKREMSKVQSELNMSRAALLLAKNVKIRQ